MILALDIGNSRIKAGMSRNGEINYSVTATRPLRDAVSYWDSLGIGDDIEGAIISSVVDELNGSFKSFFMKTIGKEPVMVSHTLDTGLTYSVTNPGEIGPDRIANAVGGYLAAQGAAVVVDLGSATTFTVVGKEKAFLGGAILPGAAMMAEALNEKTSRLPKIDLVPPSSVIGKDTANNIRSGIFIGTAGAVERVVDEIERDFGYTIKVILTGGLCEVFWSFIRNVDIVDPMLTLKGLFAIYERIIRKSS